MMTSTSMFLYLLVICVPATMGQLILGTCPWPPPFIKDLNIQKYSGDWYVVAQSRNHPLSASDCEKVMYSEKGGRLSANFSYMDPHTKIKIYKHGVLTRERTGPTGNMHLKLDDFSRHYEFHVLKSNYSDVAVEYTCLSGVFNYTASVTVLHRRPLVNLGDLSTALYRFNLTSDIAPKFRKDMKLVNHVNC